MTIVLDSGARIRASTNPLTVFSYKNGESGAPIQIDTNAGYRSLHCIRRPADPGGTAVRTQIGGAFQKDGTIHNLWNLRGKVCSWGVRMRYDGDISPFSFVNMLSWTSFITGTEGSGPFALFVSGGNFRLSCHFGTANPNYSNQLAGNHYANPGATSGVWRDYCITAYMIDTEAGWLELDTKLSTSTTWTPVLFPAPIGSTTRRYLGRTLGGSTSSIHDNRFGIYANTAGTLDLYMAEFFGAVGSDLPASTTPTVRDEIFTAMGGQAVAPPPNPPAISIKTGSINATGYTVTIGPVTNPRTGDLKQVYINDAVAKIDIPLGTTEYVATGRTTGVEDTVRASAGQPDPLGYGAWTPDAQVLRVTPTAVVTPPPPPPPPGPDPSTAYLYQRPNQDITSGTWQRTLTSSFYENLNKPVDHTMPNTDSRLSDPPLIQTSAAGNTQTFGFTTFTRPVQGFATAMLYVHATKTGNLGVTLGAKTDPQSSVYTEVGRIMSGTAQPRQTYAIPVPLTMVDTQFELDALEIQVSSAAFATPVSGEFTIFALWLEYEVAAATTSDIVPSRTLVEFPSVVQGSATSLTQKVTLSSVGHVTFTVTDNVPWLTVSPTSGTT